MLSKAINKIRLNLYQRTNKSDTAKNISSELITMQSDYAELKELKLNISLGIDPSAPQYSVIDSISTSQDLTQALLKNVTVFNMSDCQNKLKTNGILGSNNELKLLQEIITPKYNPRRKSSTKQNSIVTYKMIDESSNNIDPSNCNYTRFDVYMPYNSTNYYVNLTRVDEYQNKYDANLLNKSDPFFNDVCVNLVNETSLLDTTLSIRRELYQNKTVECGVVNNTLKCNFLTLSDGFIKCNCPFVGDFNASSKIVNDYFASNPSNTIMITCINQFSKASAFLSNPGFLINTAVLTIGVLYMIMSKLIVGAGFISSNLNTILMHDLANQLASSSVPQQSGKGFIKNDKNKKVVNDFKPYDSHQFSNQNDVLQLKQNRNLDRNKRNELKHVYNFDAIFKDITSTRQDGVADLKNNNYIQGTERASQKLTTAAPPIGSDDGLATSHPYKDDLTAYISASIITERDFAYMTTEEILVADQRKTCKFFCDAVKSTHLYLNIFLFKSIINPVFPRLLLLGISLSLLTLLNTFLFSDGLISDRIKFYSNVSEIEYTFRFIIPYSLISLAITVILRIVLCFIIHVPQKYSKDFNDYLKSTSVGTIEEGERILSKSMKWRYLLFTLIFVLLALFSIYYTTIFCNVYPSFANIFLFSCAFGLAIDFLVVAFLYALILTFIRSKARASPEGCYINIFEFVWAFKIIK